MYTVCPLRHLYDFYQHSTSYMYSTHTKVDYHFIPILTDLAQRLLQPLFDGRIIFRGGGRRFGLRIISKRSSGDNNTGYEQTVGGAHILFSGRSRHV